MLGTSWEPVIGGCRAGADWSWRVLYDDLAPLLRRYLRAAGAEDADDLVGETFVRLVRSVERFEGDERAFRAWAFTIARTRLVDEVRRRSRRPSAAVAPEQLEALGPTGHVEDDAMRSLAEQRVRAVLETLTPDQRDVLLLRLLADLTVDEVARVLGKRPGAVKALQARGLEGIRRAMSLGTVTL